MVVPLHASIQLQCGEIGFDNLTPIIWHKISNIKTEANGNGSYLGKPFEPNGVIKNDIEFLLMLRKPGGYRSPSAAARILSVISADEHNRWFRQIWSDVRGASTKKHPAPFPVELAERLIRMFSFVGDTVFDPFTGTASTQMAARQCGRSSIGIEIEPTYHEMADVWDADEHKLAEWFDKSRVLPESVREDLLRRILVYLLKVHSELKLNTMIDTVKARSQEDQIMKKLAKEWSWLTEEEIMDRCRQEGHDQGHGQGFEQGAEQASRRIAERMIREGISDQTVSECTDIPLNEVSELRNGH